MQKIKMFLPNGGNRLLEMPGIPAVGDTIHFSDSKGLGSVGEARLKVSKVSWLGEDSVVAVWNIHIDTEFDKDD
ncbi:hypothetical protein [Parasphingorhabdus halotolerans]|uniref:Uncharacterized protein n=1 Tax=Parasphingorhabdus halotolerans TaxID=2725558 RepID=A0A6H2DN39_9SPHN|nr:hypothetical protein [Parasphingorhabdus halotolerans]QJB69076.1 hypothetical protein HF685_07080 [Parasphingorhabdus halotolerans]